jgi:uncharacterized Zn ribbon protein
MKTIIRCPKCDSDDILVGSDNNPNCCSDCGHKWDYENNQETDKKESLYRKLSEALSKL